MKNIYNEVIGELSKKYNLNEVDVERIVDSQFKYLTHIINERGSKTVQLIYLGKFTTNSKTRYIVAKFNKAKLERERLNQENNPDNRGIL